MGISFLLWVIFQYYFSYFLVQIAPALANGNFFSWLPDFFDISPSLVVVVLLLGVTSLFRPILCIFSVSPKVSYFFKKPWFLSLENGFGNKIRMLAMLIATEVLMFLGPLS